MGRGKRLGIKADMTQNPKVLEYQQCQWRETLEFNYKEAERALHVD